MRVAIVGAGKVGSVLGRLLVEKGSTITCVISRGEASARRAGRFLQCNNVSTSVRAIPRNTDLIFITTPHSAVESVATQISLLKHLHFRRLAVCHASGMLTSKVLEPLRRRGAMVFSFHPLQTFPRDFEPREIVKSARGIYYGVDGSPKALLVARRVARLLKGTIIEIPPHLRPLYHAVCVVASNHLTTMLSVVEEMFRTLHTKEKKFYPVFKPILMATLHNIEKTSPARALSGPIARGGVDTLAVHCASVKRYAPSVMPYFLQLSMETVKLAMAKGSIDRRQARALRTVIRTYGEKSSHMQEAL